MPRLQMLSWRKGVRCLNLHGECSTTHLLRKPYLPDHTRSHHKCGESEPTGDDYSPSWVSQGNDEAAVMRLSMEKSPCGRGTMPGGFWNYWDLELRKVEMLGHGWHMRMMNRKAIRSISLPGFAANSSSPLGYYWPTGDFNRSSPLHSCRFPPATGFSKRNLEMTRSNIWWCHLQV